MANWRYLVVLTTILWIGTASANIFILWNGTQGGIPSGWQCESCLTGGLRFSDGGLNKIFPKIGTSFCGSDGEIPCGGASTHTNFYDSVKTDTPSATTSRLAGVPNGASAASGSHIHTSLNVTATLSATSVPLNYGLLVISATDSAEDTIPAGGIIFFNGTTAPSGFQLYDDADGYLISGTTNGSQNTITGQENHNHSERDIRTGNPSAGVNVAGTAVSTATQTHTHFVGRLNHTESQNHTPLFINMPLIYANSDTLVPIGALVMANNTNNWSFEWTKQNSTDYLGRYIRANSTSFNDTGGWVSHNHQRVVFGATGTPSATSADDAGAVSTATGAHTHSWVNVSTNNTNNNPKYTNVTLFKLDISLPEPADCWTNSGGLLSIPIGCLFKQVIGGLFEI